MGVTIKSPEDGDQEMNPTIDNAVPTPEVQEVEAAHAPAEPEPTSDPAEPAVVEPEPAAVEPVEEPVAAAPSEAPRAAVPDAPTFSYRVSAWFSSVAHRLTVEEQSMVAGFKEDLCKEHAALLASEVKHLDKKIAALEAKAAVKSKELKDKYLG